MVGGVVRAGFRTERNGDDGPSGVRRQSARSEARAQTWTANTVILIIEEDAYCLGALIAIVLNLILPMEEEEDPVDVNQEQEEEEALNRLDLDRQPVLPSQRKSLPVSGKKSRRGHRRTVEGDEGR